MRASAAIAGRTGLPVTTVCAPAGTRSVALEAQRQRVGAPRQEPVGAAQHRVLLVQITTAGRRRSMRAPSTGATDG